MKNDEKIMAEVRELLADAEANCKMLRGAALSTYSEAGIEKIQRARVLLCDMTKDKWSKDMRWIKLSDEAPPLEGNVLLHKVSNEGQELQSTTVYPAAMVKHCHPAETWWMPLPEPPTVKNSL